MRSLSIARIHTAGAWISSALLLSVVAGPVTPAAPADALVSPARTTSADFVQRSGNRLTLAGRTFRFSGPNIYWLGLDENSRTTITYPTPLRVESALTAAAAMGATVVRSHTLGIGVGNPLSIEPSLGVFNQIALRHIDLAIADAGRLGLRLIVPLVDNYDYYHGGYHVFTDWLGLSGSRCPSTTCAQTFFTDPRAIAAFERYVSVILNHVNVYTGVANKDDPTIMAWETGNEIRPPVSWTRAISAFIKSIDGNHLVEDGYAGVDESDLALTDVDIVSDHFYPLNTPRLVADASTVSAAGKVFVAGEYGWNEPGGLAPFLRAAESARGLSGDLYWSLGGLNDDFGYEQHYDGYEAHLPGDRRDVGGPAPALADTSDAPQVAELRDHAFAMSGRPVPRFPVPAAPAVTNVEHLPAGNLLEWTGSAVAGAYEVQRLGADGSWATIGLVSGDATSDPWLDRGAPDGPGVAYRVVAVNPNDVGGPPSVPFTLNDRTVVDPLSSFASSWSHTPGLSTVTGDAALFTGDTTRVGSGGGAQQIAWNQPGLGSVEAVGYYRPLDGDLPSSDVVQGQTGVIGVEGVASPSVLHFQFLLSRNGRDWRLVPGRDVAVNGGAAAAKGDWTPYLYTVEGVQSIVPQAAFVAIRWGAGAGGTAQLGTVRMTIPHDGATRSLTPVGLAGTTTGRG